MSRSARKSKRPDPTVAPVTRVFATGSLALRDRFSPSDRPRRLQQASALARAANRKGTLGLKARHIAID